MKLSNGILIIYSAVVGILTMYGTVAVVFTHSGRNLPWAFMIPYTFPGGVLLETVAPKTTGTAVITVFFGLLAYFAVLFAPLLVLLSAARKKWAVLAAAFQALLLAGHCGLSMAVLGGIG